MMDTLAGTAWRQRRGYIKVDAAAHLAIPTHVTCTSQNPTHCIESDTETRFFTKPNILMSDFQEFRHVRFRSGSTWFNDLSRCDKPLCLPPPSSAARDADTPLQCSWFCWAGCKSITERKVMDHDGFTQKLRDEGG
ncbi:hypothetical protein K438DRAFT_1756053 [Mycena galopus ATCC 62051]|nr:hypothetical protein K438DRAFT_1756053 [Mycena galopus ATCC 62051]